MTLPSSPNGPSRLRGMLSKNWPRGEGAALALELVAGGVKLPWLPGSRNPATSSPMKIATVVLSVSSQTSFGAVPRASCVRSSARTMARNTSGGAIAPSSLRISFAGVASGPAPSPSSKPVSTPSTNAPRMRK